LRGREENMLSANESVERKNRKMVRRRTVRINMRAGAVSV
jgi:hypothetical protein